MGLNDALCWWWRFWIFAVFQVGVGLVNGGCGRVEVSGGLFALFYSGCVCCGVWCSDSFPNFWVLGYVEPRGRVGGRGVWGYRWFGFVGLVNLVLLEAGSFERSGVVQGAGLEVWEVRLFSFPRVGV